MDIDFLLKEHNKRDLLRFSTIGSVDDGKSTLIGRLLYDSKNIYEDQLKSIEKKIEKKGGENKYEFSYLLDGLKSEREQGITIDVAYRYFSTLKRKFIIADTPGHKQYTRNMVAGVSNSSLSIILIDAQKGVLEQTKRHAFIASLLRVPHIVVAINKIDNVLFSKEVFEKIKEDFMNFSWKLQFSDVRFIPLSAKHGDNVVKRSSNTNWYKGESLLEILENIYIASDKNFVDFRLPIQYVIRGENNQRAYAGQISSGILRKGDEILVLPSNKKTSVKKINIFENEKSEAFPQMSISVELENEIDVSPGDMIVKPGNMPQVKKSLDAMLVWMDEESLSPGKTYYLKHTTKTVRAKVEEISYLLDISELKRTHSKNLELNDIGRVFLNLDSSIYCDPYIKNRLTGCFILIDALSGKTSAAGVIIDRKLYEVFEKNFSYEENVKNFLYKETNRITKRQRELKNSNHGVTIWMTGFSGSGKSTISKELERNIFDLGKQVYLLDGDNIRLGINKDLGFSNKDRSENVRRVSEIAHLFNDAGLIVIAAFISPFKKDRALAKKIIGKENFIEIFVSASLETCEKRDPKGLYKKARCGEIPLFTGISSPYEAPQKPDLVVETEKMSLDASVQLILQKIHHKI